MYNGTATWLAQNRSWNSKQGHHTSLPVNVKVELWYGPSPVMVQNSNQYRSNSLFLMWRKIA